MESVSVPYEIVLVVDVIMSIFWFVCLSLTAYFYAKAYLTVRKWNRTRICPGNVLVVKEKLDESNFAYTTFWLTVFFAVSGFPIIVVSLYRRVSPFFRQVSTIRWAELILQLNSLFNPLLYWYRTRRLRNATLELLCCRHSATERTVSHIRQRRSSVASLNVEEFQSEQKRPRFLPSKSLGVVMCSDTFRGRSNKAVKERSMPAPSRVARDEKFTQQRNQLTVTVQIENAPGGKDNLRKIESQKNLNTTELGRSRRPSSLKENSFMTPTEWHQNATQWNAQRSRSVPIILTNLREPNDEQNRNC